MINLIPKEEEKIMKKDFFLRLSSMILISFSIYFLIASFSVLPSYFISSAKVSVIEETLNTETDSTSSTSYEEYTNLAGEINKKLDFIEREKFLPSVRVIDTILLEKRSDIKITQILYENEANGKKVSITGLAPSREILLLFRLALENNPAFKSVNLPVSNFVKGSNIQFNLNLIPS